MLHMMHYRNEISGTRWCHLPKGGDPLVCSPRCRRGVLRGDVSHGAHGNTKTLKTFKHAQTCSFYDHAIIMRSPRYTKISNAKDAYSQTKAAVENIKSKQLPHINISCHQSSCTTLMNPSPFSSMVLQHYRRWMTS